jgi:hypothetical protein
VGEKKGTVKGTTADKRREHKGRGGEWGMRGAEESG